jgi:putative transposase
MLEGLNKQVKPNRMKLQSTLPKLKQQHPELKNVYSKVLQYEPYRLFSNLYTLGRLRKNGKKVGRLRFKGKGFFKTFTYNQSGFQIISTGTRCQMLHLSKIGDIPIRAHKSLRGAIKQVTVKRYASGKWFAMLAIDKIKVGKSSPDKKVGIDVGIKHFLTDSDGRQIENPRFYLKVRDRIRIEQRRLSKKLKDSKNRERQKIKVAKLYEKLVNRRNDYLHKLSRFYANNYGFISVEDLDIKNLVRSHKVAQKILDASWSKFIQMLSYKAESAGGKLIKVNPRGTSKEYRYGKLDRDYNASLNILKRGLTGQGLPFEPVEIRPLRELTQVPASLIIEAGSPSL